jgi:hypothetical protein
VYQSTDLEAEGHLDVGKNKEKGQESQYKERKEV